MAWIYDKNGQQKCEIKRLSYTGTFMEVSRIMVTVESPEPIDFAIGDYIDWAYDGLRYKLDTAAGVEKQARKNSIGNAFIYENLVFLSPLNEANHVDFFDVVLGNTIEFLTNTEFSFYGTAWDYAKRLEANLGRAPYGNWKIRIWTNGVCYDDSPATGIDTGAWESKLVDVSGIKCLEGFQQIYNLWGCAYVFSVVSGVNYVDFYDDFEQYAKTWQVGGVDKIFAYGKGNGLYKIRHTPDADHVLVTRLRAYGSSENLPANYYFNSPDYHVNGNESSELAISHLMLPASQWEKMGDKSPANAYLDSNVGLYGVREGVVLWDGSDSELGEIKPTIYGLTIQDLLNLMSSGDTYRPVEAKWPDTTQRIDKIVIGAAPTDNGAVAEAGYDYTETESIGSLSSHSFGATQVNRDIQFDDLVMGTTPSVSHLADFRIVPTSENKVAVSFDIPDTIASLIDNVTAYLIPYVGGVKVEDATFPCSVSEESIYITFGGVSYTKRYKVSLLDSTGNPIVFSTMLTGAVTFHIVGHINFRTGMEPDNSFPVVRNGYSVNFSLLRGNKAIDKFFSVTVPQIGFDLAAAVSGSSKLCIRSGANQPREFAIVPSSVRYNESTDTWYIRCKRSVDQSTKTYFPNSDVVIASGDEYYLSGIAMPSLYVEIAAQKLLEAATAWLQYHSNPRMLSSVEVDNKIMAEEGIVLKEGMALPITDADLGITTVNQESRVIDNIRIEEGTDPIRTFSITLRDKKEKSALDAAIRGATSDFATNSSVSEAVNAAVNTGHGSLTGRDLPNQHPISSISGLEEKLSSLSFFEQYVLPGNAGVAIKLRDEYVGLFSNGWVSSGGISTSGGGGGGSVNALRDWANYRPDDTTQVLGSNLGKGLKDSIETLEGYFTNGVANNAADSDTLAGHASTYYAHQVNLGSTVYTASNGIISLPAFPTSARELTDADDLCYVDPDEGVSVTIDDPGVTGTVLWGAESANQVALDVNGVSKTLVKMQALDGIRSSITTLLGYFSGGASYNALALEGHSSSYFATATGLNNLATTVAGLVTGVSSVAGKTGAVSLVIGDVSGLTEALAGKQAAGNYVNTIGGAYGVITLGPGLTMSGNQLSVTGQTQGTVTRVYVGNTAYNPDTNGYVTLPLYAFGAAGTDYVPITIGSTTKNVLTAHQSLSGYATETWVGQQGFITRAVNDLVNYYTKSQTYTQTEVNALIAAINQFHYEVYASTSAVTDPQPNVLYLIGPTGSGSDKYEEYVYPNSTTGWVKIGDTSIDLTPYLTITSAQATYQPIISDLSTIRSRADEGHTIYGYFTNGVLGLEHVPDDDRLSYVDPEAGDDITIDDPGTTGTVLWGAESANNVALDVNGVSKTLVKQAALDGVYSSISSLSALIGTKQDYISDLSSIRSNASLGATAYSWGDHRQAGYLTSVPTASAQTLGVVKVGNGLRIDDGVLSVTGQTQGTVTRVDVGSTQYSPDVNGVVGLPAYPVIPTVVSAFTNDAGYLTAITGAMVTAALGYTPFNSANFTKANIQTTLGISNWALASSAPTYAFSDLTAHPTTLSGYDITDAKFSSAGVADKIRITLGSNYHDVLTAHQSLSGYATESWVSQQITNLNLGAASQYGVASAVASGGTGLTTSGLVYSYVNTMLSSVLKWIGETTTDIVTNPTANPVTIEGQSVTAVAGNVVSLSGTSKEFRFDGTRWKEMGDEASYAYKTVTISAGTGLTGGGTLEVNRTISLNQDSIDKLALAASALQSSDLTGYVNSIDVGQVAETSVGFVSGVSKQANSNEIVFDYSNIYPWALASTKPSYSLSEISGTDDLQAIEGLTGTSGLLKKTAANTWTLDTNSYLTGITSAMVTSALGYTPFNSANFTQAQIKLTLGISDWALAANKPSYNFSEIGSKPTTLAGYGITDALFGAHTAGSDNIPITLGSTTQNVLIAHQSLAGYVNSINTASEAVVGKQFLSGVSKVAASGVIDFQFSRILLDDVDGTDDLKAIEALTGTSGLLRKTGSNAWSLDTTQYITKDVNNLTNYYTKTEVDARVFFEEYTLPNNGGTAIKLKDAYVGMFASGFVSSGGISTAGGGGGTTVNALRDWANYRSDDMTQVLGSNLGKGLKDSIETLQGYFTNGVAKNAAEAASLALSHTIWGQSFNGTQNVSGAMSGVSAIDSLMYFDATNGRVGIGISSPAYSLDVSGTSRISGNCVIGGDLTLTNGHLLLSGTNANVSTPAVYGSLTYNWYDHEDIDRWDIFSSGEADFHSVEVREGINFLDPYLDEQDHDVYHAITIDNGSFAFSSPISIPGLAISSNSLVSNLNADLLDGHHAADFALVTDLNSLVALAIDFNWVFVANAGTYDTEDYIHVN